MHAENVKEDKKMNRKKLIMILATITILTTITTSLFFVQNPVAATTYDENNIVVNGVLASDSYVLYPYTKENLIIGVSKYGELINGVAQQGLEYDGMDVFANPNVWEEDWSQGWFIDIHYADKDNSYKNVWAFAMYTDLSGSTGIGKDWQEGCTEGPLGATHGGRKTNGGAITDPLKILYDGPRRFVALTKTTIYEGSEHEKPLVSITITFVFNKVKKYVILFKDIKRLDKGKWGRTFQVEFSNRGEWDIGTTSAPPSYAHFYDNLPTVYDYEYHDFYNATYDITGFDVAQIIDEGGSYVGFAAFWPQLFGKTVDGTGHVTPQIVLSSLCTKEYNQTWESLGSPVDRNITFALHGWPISDPYPRGAGEWSDAPMVFKNRMLLTEGIGKEYTWDGVTDVIIFATEPDDSDYITVVYKNGTNVDADDMNNYVDEPKTPYVIGEWCFDLEDVDQKRQFRAVTVYGLTDRHDADDDDTLPADQLPTGWSSGAQVMDCEVLYYLDEIFNPFDLYSAVHKGTRRWVDFHNVTTAEVTAEMVSFNLTHTSVMKPTPWIEYCNSAEKVKWDGELRTPARASDIFGGFNYTLTVWPDGNGTITIIDDNVPEAYTMIKVLYTANATKEKIDLITIEEGTLSYQLLHWPVILNTERFGSRGIVVIDKSGEGPAIFDTTNYTITPENGTLTFGNATGFEVYPDDEFNVIYEIWGGRYEWTIVGRDAHTVDSIGAALVTAAFKNKNVEIGNAGMGMMFTEYDISSVPYIMDCFGTAPGTRTDYKDNGTTPGDRTALRDDWCETWPIASSNIIGVGGPLANLFSLYLNDFTSAFYGNNVALYGETYTPYEPWAEKVVALTCWDRQAYASSASTGYATIGTYKDINGTVGLVIWGIKGRDTFYACQWLHENIHDLQTINIGVTSIILEIDYEDPEHPLFDIVEYLGTISEKPQHDC